MAYSFQKIIFIGQNLKHFRMTYSFLELLIFFLIKSSRYLAFGVYFSPQQYWCWKNLFFYVNLKPLMNNFNFSQFYKHVFRSSRWQIFFKIGALKNFAIFWIKKGLEHGCFPVCPVNVGRFLKEQLFYRTHQVAACAFFKK